MTSGTETEVLSPHRDVSSGSMVPLMFYKVNKRANNKEDVLVLRNERFNMPASIARHKCVTP